MIFAVVELRKSSPRWASLEDPAISTESSFQCTESTASTMVVPAPTAMLSCCGFIGLTADWSTRSWMMLR